MEQYREQTPRGTSDFPYAYYGHQLAEYRVKLHWHPEIELLYGISGSLSVQVSEEQTILQPGDILFINPEELHTYSTGNGTAQYHAAVFSADLFQMPEQHYIRRCIFDPLLSGRLRLPRRLYPEHPAYTAIQSIVSRLFSHEKDEKTMIFADLINLFCTLHQQELLEQCEVISRQKSHNIKKSIAYMQTHYTEKITLSELADLANLSPNYYCSYFKKLTGVTPFVYLNTLRVKRAARLLKSENLPIPAVAEACGFENVSFFIRKFRETYRTTPGAYRKENL